VVVAVRSGRTGGVSLEFEKMAAVGRGGGEEVGRRGR
jgi:hypothetical protein